ncbi:MAG: hemerythrin domain-containing protein [Acidobacteriaceae bacterium]
MLLQIGQKPESDFHHPIGMLEDCHKRILFFLKNLIKVVSEADAGSLDPGQRVTLEKALKYFREAAPRHTADEEESLFPRLRRIDTPAIGELFGKIDCLENEHRWADEQHLQVDAICRGWLEMGPISADVREGLRGTLNGLLDFYERHIQIEEAEIFSAARNLIDDSEKELIGEEMATRRGLTMCGAPANAGGSV